jgi:hypothetical protein
METFKSENPFLKIDPFYNEKMENLINIVKELIKNKNIKELIYIQELLNKRLNELNDLHH